MRNFRINLKKVEEKNPFIGCKYCLYSFNFHQNFSMFFGKVCSHKLQTKQKVDGLSDLSPKKKSESFYEN